MVRPGDGPDMTRADTRAPRSAADPSAALDAAERALADGDLTQAQNLVRDALALDPERARALFLSGKLERLAGRTESATQLLERAARLEPAHVGTRLQLAKIYQRAREFDRCLDELSLVLYHEPHNADAYFEMAVVHRLRGDIDGAIDFLKQALERDSEHAQALNELGWLYCGRERFKEALDVLERAIEVDPDNIPAQNNLGFACVRLEEYERALAVFQKLCRRTSKSMLWQRVNLGNAYDHTGNFAESERAYEHVLRYEPNHFTARWNRSHLALGRQQFDSSWPDYDYRMLTEGVGHARLVPFAPWKGEPLAGKRLVISAEQGLGDQIMFASCIPELLRQGASLILECDHRLAELFQRSFPEVRVIGSRHEMVPKWLREVGHPDYHVPAGSLPGFFRKRLEDFPEHQGYLRADPDKVARWRKRLDALGPGLKVGLSWRGGTRSTRRRLRSLSLTDLLPLLRIPGCRFVSLQYGDIQADLDALRQSEGIEIAYWKEAIADYDETAALCAALDFTVSVCTSVIHLNGALGRPAWVMVPAVAEWRYGRQGERMPWYPSIRLLRQTAGGDWSAVLATVASGLAARAIA